MNGIIIGAVSFTRITLRINESYILVSINQGDISSVKREFKVEHASQLIDRMADIDILAQRIFAVDDGEGENTDQTEGVPCAYISFP